MATITIENKDGSIKIADISLDQLINIPIGGAIMARFGIGFQPSKLYEKVSDYAFREVSFD